MPDCKTSNFAVFMPPRRVPVKKVRALDDATGFPSSKHPLGTACGMINSVALSSPMRPEPFRGLSRGPSSVQPGNGKRTLQRRRRGDRNRLSATMTTVTIRPGVTRQGEGGNKKRAKDVAVRPWLDSTGETRGQGPSYTVGSPELTDDIAIRRRLLVRIEPPHPSRGATREGTDDTGPGQTSLSETIPSDAVASFPRSFAARPAVLVRGGRPTPELWEKGTMEGKSKTRRVSSKQPAPSSKPSTGRRGAESVPSSTPAPGTF
ncbi:hypothetical protein EDB80DRAFT_681690 [Ilyonectria destructans]|nr:hypothetical protein EDB80DRAFT_681690 [Ilyonectria destructans]